VEGFQPRESLPSRVESTSPAGSDEAREAAYAWLGDLRVRFVATTAGGTETPLRVAGLKGLELTPVQAFAAASVNARPLLPSVQVMPLAEGVSTLRLATPEAGPALLLQRAFWRQRLDAAMPALLVAVPNRSTVRFAPAGDEAAVAALRRMATRLLHGAGANRLSACLLRFDEKGWQVQERLPPAPEPAAVAVVANEMRPRVATEASVDDGLDADEALDLAARGQRILIHTIALNFVVNAIQRSGAMPPLPLFALSMAVGVYALVGFTRICSGTGRGQGQKIFFMSTSFVPLLNVVCMIWLSVGATRRLRAAGWRVGLFGARPA
jgi:hypothetical protein